MSGIGKRIKHDRYGLAIVTNVWYKIINPVDKTRVVDGLTFEIATTIGRDLHNKDRSYNGTLNSKPLPRCYEGNLARIKVVDNATRRK